MDHHELLENHDDEMVGYTPLMRFESENEGLIQRVISNHKFTHALVSVRKTIA